jgi:hypothetical protein
MAAFGRWSARAGYGLAVGIGGGLVSLLLVLVSGPPFSNREQWKAIALGWSVLGGVVLVASSVLSGVFLHGYYVQCHSRTAGGLVLAANVLAVAALSLLAAAWAAGITFAG